MTEAKSNAQPRGLTARNREHAEEIIAAKLKAFFEGGPDEETACVTLALLWGIDADQVREDFAEARASRPAPKPKSKVAALRPKRIDVVAYNAKPKALFISPAPQPAQENLAQGADEVVAEGKEKAKARSMEELFLPQSEPETNAEPRAKPGALVPIGEIILPVAAKALQQVETLNQKHAVIGNYGTKCAVLSWERWNINRDVMVPTFQSFSDFRNRYMNRYVLKETEDGTEKVAAGKYWLQHPARMTYEGVAFEPGALPVLEGNRLNLWRGFAITPKEGCWDLMRDHIYTVLGNGDAEAGRYIEWWIGWMAQNPGRPAEAVLALRGDEGAGKGVLARAVLRWFGIYGLPITDPRHLIGAFSGHLQHCCALYLDEAFAANNKGAEGRLKSLVTEPTITIEPKYFQPFQVPNVLHILMASNNDWVVPAGHGSRRYAVYQASDARIGDFGYFNRLNAELDGGGAEAMLWDLLRLDLGDWHPKQIYETDALLEQKQLTLHGLDAWIEALLQEGVLPNAKENYPNRSLTRDLVASARRFDPHTNDSEVPRTLQKILRVSEFSNGNARGWKFLPLPDCRRMWEKRNGGRWRWHRSLTRWGECESILDRPA